MEHSGESYDLVIIGSGGGGLSAALAAHAQGDTALVIEKGKKFGGSTAMSGGILWLPGHPLIAGGANGDTIHAGRTYLNTLIGDGDEASAPTRREAFLRAIDPMMAMLHAAGLKFYACENYSDYYDELPGGRAKGRAIGAKIISAKKLGALADKLMMLPGWNLPALTDEFADFSLAGRTVKGKIMAARIALRILRQRLTGAPVLARGAALQARMLIALQERGIPLRGETAVVGLIEENGRVSGVRVRAKDGSEQEIRARKGVLIASGGYAHNPEIRHREQPEGWQPGWSLANPGDTGDLVAMAKGLGAKLSHLNESWWLPISLKKNGQVAGFHSPQEMQKPYGIAVNARGERFVNESASYMEIGQAIFASGSVPAWIVMEARHRKYYPWGAVPPRVMPKSWLESGYMKRANTLEDLAQQCGIDPAGLRRTVDRFNGFAKAGRDEDFHRGARAYDRYYGDPRVKPNATLGPIEEGPFYAVQIVPGDVGTAGGMMADENARVLREDGQPIPGLYVCGNASAPVFGRTYPGPGASIAASFVFGYLAARHAGGANA